MDAVPSYATGPYRFVNLIPLAFRGTFNDDVTKFNDISEPRQL